MIGQFFTPLGMADDMAKLIDINAEKVNILDPGCGTGILTIALLKRILESKKVAEVIVMLYEKDKQVITTLKKNLNYIKGVYARENVKLNFIVKNEDFILGNKDNWEKNTVSEKFDIVICNPPYMKILKDSVEAEILSEIVYGQPNMYYLFMAMSLHLLKEDGQFVYITPKSYFSGTYFVKFRKWFLEKADLQYVRLFESRRQGFLSEKVLQELVIVKGYKRKEQGREIRVCSIENSGLKSNFIVDSNMVLDNRDKYYIKIPSSEEQYKSLCLVESFPSNLSELDIKVSTGKVVPFRNNEDILDEQEIRGDTCPLIWNSNIQNGGFKWPISEKNKFQILKLNMKLVIKNDNYILLRRMTTKEEIRRIRMVCYFKEFIPTKYVAIENHVNYLYRKHGELTKTEVRGLFVYLNSTIVNDYFNVLCGGTQINATELNSLKLPNERMIYSIGRKAAKINIYSVEECDKIIRRLLKKG